MASMESIIPILDEFEITRIHKQGLIELVDDVNDYLKKILQVAKTIKFQSRRKKLKISDINDSLEFLAELKLYGYSNTSIPSYIPIPQSDVLLSEEKMTSIDDILRSNSVSVPEEENFTFHWQLIKGETPVSPEIQLEEKNDQIMPQEIDWKIGNYKIKGRHSEPISNQCKEKFTRIIEQFLENNNENIYEEIEKSADARVLAPFYIKFITDFITVNLFDSLQTERILVFTEALFHNEFFAKEVYSNSFFSIALTLAISPEHFNGAHCFDIRDEASIFLEEIIQYFSKFNPFIKENILKRLNMMLSTNNYQQRYGLLRCIFAISQNTFKSIIIPKILTELKSIKESFHENPSQISSDVLQLISLYKSLTKDCYVQLPNHLKNDENTISMYEGILSFSIM
ncbi:hypothetical protein TVAG_491320 [Trichomonas vaginalis G3]|uniref:TAF6 C-terminal HEAT repeat domain-containing protein n=1 Tax=Trichomonas vaginalis (strain ATCC PRA-98 / G3) TaxID=412133 RepID=A2E074_TRIV3|nr:transcription initiation factor TFIID family [Trichomonas vaginalis G3]EAY13993.1 hypothetical protein TVAG_491320 [Trichomonas vaginalis G3]KAI5551818.1 transcription initiation factor TFIID family [Trichomonas vaginalis G3]|eukprot:XP_001326216.1 hypothetical protein [Trichomonas vaginalis G3]